MVQFNLLPDIKLEYIKARRTRRLLTLISAVASIGALAVLLLMFLTVNVVQKKSLSDENRDIATYSAKLKSISNLDKILTVQNQLTTLTALHDQKPVATRLFGYVTQLTPTQATLNKLTVDFTANNITFGGSAPTLDVVSTYTDALKGATYTTDSNHAAVHAFSGVVLSSFGRDNKGATFTITANFDPAIFDSTQKIQLAVPNTASVSQSSVFGARS